MIAYAYATQSEKTVSGALTLLMHGLFLVLLVFGIAWQKRERPAMVAELWSNLPPPPAPKVEAPPPPKVEPKPQPPKPIPKVEPKPAPKPVPKPDISLREKKEKALKAKELAEKKKKEEQARLEALKQQQAKEAEERRLREQEEALKKLAAQQAAARAQTIDEYTRRIHDRIRSRIVNAGCLSLKNPEVQLQVILLPDGNVLDEPRVRKSSGAATCDAAVTRAVILAQPLPLPPDKALFPRFRDLNLNFRPND
jgi:colicin import membrane protein